MCNIHSVQYSVNPFIYCGLEFLKNHRRGDQEFLVNMRVVAHIERDREGCL